MKKFGVFLGLFCGVITTQNAFAYADMENIAGLDKISVSYVSEAADKECQIDEADIERSVNSVLSSAKIPYRETADELVNKEGWLAVSVRTMKTAGAELCAVNYLI